MVTAVLLVAAACTSATSSSGPRRCGKDISNLHSSVVSLAADTGIERWSAEIPLAATYRAVVDGDELHIRLEGDGVNEVARLDATTGDHLGTAAEVQTWGITQVSADLPDARPPAKAGDMRAEVDGELVPWYVDVGPIRVSRSDRGDTIEGSDLATGTSLWVWPADRAGVSFPTEVDGTVVVVTSDQGPACP
jgi:hypothetical protein